MVRERFVLDFISGKTALKETPKEQCANGSRALGSTSTEPPWTTWKGDFPVVVGNRRRRVDLADYAAD